MQIEGKLIKHLETQTGEGKNGSWQKSAFVIETPDAKYPKIISFQTWGDMVSESQAVAPGADVKVSFDIESREYNGKYYTDAKCFKIEINNAATTETPVKRKSIERTNNKEDLSDLPF